MFASRFVPLPPTPVFRYGARSGGGERGWYEDGSVRESVRVGKCKKDVQLKDGRKRYRKRYGEKGVDEGLAWIEQAQE